VASKVRSRRSRSNASKPAPPDAAAHAWQRALRLLAAHDRSEHEIRNRLAARGVAPGSIDETVRRLLEHRYLDDRRLAHNAAEQACRRGYGSEYVRAQLATKGVAESLIDEALAARFDDEPALARRTLAQRYPDAPSSPAERSKAARFLLRRGFPEAVVFAILGEDC
jgi:regulatory protein